MTIGARRGQLCGLRRKHLQARHHATPISLRDTEMGILELARP
jgi:hypothetical protein